jgi:ribosomal subunit interface protein
MQVPLEIRFNNMTSSPAIEQAVRERAEKLEQFADDIVSCRVTIEAPHKHHRKGKLFHVSVDVRLPGGEVVASRDPALHHAHEDVYVALRDSFKAVRRRLEDRVRVRRGDVKAHEVPPHGIIIELNTEEGFGRISTPDGREIYFHRNSVLNADFDDLRTGLEVRFSEESGDLGPQASTVRIIGKHHLPG